MTRTIPDKVLVVGGSRGIGAAAVVQLAREGIATAIGYVANDEAAKRTQAAAAATGGPEPVLVRGDLGKDAAGMVTRAAEELGGLGGFLTTAVPILAGRTLGVTREEYDLVFDVQVWGLWEAIQTAVPELEKVGGSVVACSSLGANRYARYYGAIGPAKAAMENLVRYFGAELGPRGIRVNGVSPSLVDNPGHGGEDIIAGVQDVIQAVADKTPLRRLSQPEEIASVAVALMSSDFSFVTGLTIPVDGGYTLLA
ncbi:SDR family oxidoreductase [Nocardioides marmoriginsengisoli]|uniref:SDR family oxidoreductase n=1 Tax=Nocardioides marmoriginsengisoli TaxID=661483 RepID=A0A3N0CH58_9ACTN|nr:SDR family oxidoreductase [Nocardioides marmoriginsengisoli]RNL62356.1 SDR family oxidoreductase [Nocardioides marmoriginsengisoli]